MHQGFTEIKQPEILGPSLPRQILNLAKEVPKLVASGFKTVPEAVYEQRMGICRTCHFWDEAGNMGAGKCNHPKCGCTKKKLTFASQSCPVGSWGVYAE